jgi:hypothetical protein
MLFVVIVSASMLRPLPGSPDRRAARLDRPPPPRSDCRRPHPPLESLAAGAVLAVAAVIRGPLAAVPENAMKFAVGLLLLTFGTFWSGEGRGIDWPLEDGAIPVLLNVYIATSLAAVWLLHARLDRRLAARSASAP